MIPSRIGLIAGGGNFPVFIAQAARSQGVEIVSFAIHKLADESLKNYSVAHNVLKITELGKFIDLCRRFSINKVIMAGRVPHDLLLMANQLSFDKKAWSIIMRLPDKKADTVLNAVTTELSKEGIEVLDSTLFLKNCMPEPGVLTPRITATEEILRDIEFGYPLAKEIGRLDIGQTIAVKNQIVVAVEALEGTDEMIRRVGVISPGAVFIKVSKPRQDMRFDVPVIGMTTIRNLAQAQATALCVTAGQSLFFDRPEAIELAEQNRIFIYARSDEQVQADTVVE